VAVETRRRIIRITRVITDNGACYRAAAFTRSLSDAARHQRTRPFTPRHNGKVERYQRILAEELLYARTWTSETQRAEAIRTWAVHYNYHRPHTAAGNRPPASRLHAGVTKRHDEQQLVGIRPSQAAHMRKGGQRLRCGA
jgi:transposase InsO family protein